jgi:hypothetical protein
VVVGRFCVDFFDRFSAFKKVPNMDQKYYLSHQYRNKSKCQLTRPTPAQLPAVAVSSGHKVCLFVTFKNAQTG